MHVTLFRCKTLFDIVFKRAWLTIDDPRRRPAVKRSHLRDLFAPLCFSGTRYMHCDMASNNFYSVLDTEKVSLKVQQKGKETKMILFR